ncbi:MAG: response regulator [Acidobacteria bacterium]|nr:response regulator [Acidobacteriota bacterium]
MSSPDWRAGPTVAANSHLKLMFGFDSDADVSEVCPFAGDRFVDPRARLQFLNQLRRDGAVSDYLLRLRRTDDSSIWVEVTATLHGPDANGAQRLDALVRDVSERRKMEDQGRDLSQQLGQAEKMAALGQTVSGVAHELNNPLATILALAERLAARPVDTETRRGLETILGESERAAKIVRNLLTFARKRNTTRAQVDLNAVVRETFALRAYEQRLSNITTVDALARGLPQLFADPHQVKQILLNLIINAEQAMLGAHGRGTLVARTWYDSDNDCVRLELNDDGPGVPEEVRTKIFEPFFTTKAVGKGTGLGLAVAYALVEEHGGRISVESEPGAGASFFVSFPAATGMRSTRPAAVTLPPPVASGSTVLVVEDEPALASAVADALTDAGYRVDRAGDGEEALERIATKVFDLVVCDLKMPRVDGPAFYRILSQRKPSLARHVLFVTGDVAGTEAERFLLESGCRWLLKPFRLADLLRVASEVLG